MNISQELFELRTSNVILENNLMHIRSQTDGIPEIYKKINLISQNIAEGKGRDGAIKFFITIAVSLIVGVGGLITLVKVMANS